MSRPIKYRGKRVSNGEWVYGGLVISDNGDMHILQSNKKKGKEGYKLDYWLVDPETVGQYTGLTDRNGIDAYEGDIIYFGGKPQIIKWSETISGFAMWQGVGATTGIIKVFEVIGNIYTHPHLMEVSNI